MRRALHELAVEARQHGIRLYLAMTPDVHDLVNYRLGFVHDLVARIAAEEGYEYVDLLPPLRNLTPAHLWSMPGDPHPNALGHRLMAQGLYPAMRR
jgi:lysophospholipase L1-like esterase